MKEKFCILGILLFSMVATVPLSSFAGSPVSQPQWKQGDFWRYEEIHYGNGMSSYNVSVVEEVIGHENATVNGTVIAATVMEKHENIRGENATYRIYFRSGDLAILKYEYVGENYLIIYQFPWDRWDYPIQIGESWRCEVNETRYMPAGNVDTVNFTVSYNCTKKIEVDVPAGSFSCLTVRAHSLSNPDNYSVYYVSPDVGREVKTESYTDGELSSRTVLLSFSYGGRTSEDGKEVIPGFGIISLVLSISIVAAFTRKRTNGSV
jgi:hypothetical protein